MEKIEFITRISKQISGRLNGIERRVEIEISGRKSRSDAPSFYTWLKSEQANAASNPALRKYDLFHASETPEQAAKSLADYIDTDLDGVVNWQEQLTATIQVWMNKSSSDWKYGPLLEQYLKGIGADIRARVFARHIDIIQGGFDIDIPGIVDSALRNYQTLTPQRDHYVQTLTTDLGRNLETARVLGYPHLKSVLIKNIEGCKTVFASWNMAIIPNFPPEMIEAEKADMEMTIRFNEALLADLNKRQQLENLPAKSASKYLKTKQEKKLPAFETFFNPGGMERALSAAIAVGLIEKSEEGYSWIYKGAKSHGVCAFWFAAKVAGLTKKNLKNNERITGAIQVFFKMDTLAKGTLDNVNESSSEYKALKKKLENLLI